MAPSHRDTNKNLSKGEWNHVGLRLHRRRQLTVDLASIPPSSRAGRYSPRPQLMLHLRSLCCVLAVGLWGLFVALILVPPILRAPSPQGEHCIGSTMMRSSAVQVRVVLRTLAWALYM